MNIDEISKYNKDYGLNTKKFKHSNFLEINNGDICRCGEINMGGSEETTFHHANCDLKSHHNCSNVNLYNAIIFDDYMDKVGGATKTKKKTTSSIPKTTATASNVSTTSGQPDFFKRKINIVQTIANKIISKLKSENMLVTNDLILELIKNVKISEKDMYIDRSIIDDVIKYINFILNKDVKTYNHSLITFTREVKDLEQIRNMLSISDYSLFSSNVKMRADSYENICENFNTYPYFYFNKHETMIPAMVFALFGAKLPVLFDVVAYQDLFQMMHEIEHNDSTNYRNILLLLLRLADKEPYTVKGHLYDNQTNSEYSRIFLSIAFKKIIYGIMEGKISSRLMGVVMGVLNKFYDPNCKNKDELFLVSILKIWSLKPTLVKTVNGEHKPVFFYEYDINNTTIDVLAKFGGDILNFSYYDDKTKRIYFSLKNFTDFKNNSTFPSINTLQSFNVLQSNPFTQNVSYLNYGPSFNSTIINTMGILIVSTPRHKFLFGSSDRSINTKIIDFQKNITIGNSLLELRSAVCHKVNDTLLNITECGMKISVGRYALLKIGFDKWIKYDPDFYVYKKETLETIIDFKNNIENTTINDLNQELFGAASDYDIIKTFRDGMYMYGGTIIPETEAYSLINTTSSIVIYAQDYNTYTSQCINRC
jgi:hypothetical protein